jgi:hypothetical protein
VLRPSLQKAGLLKGGNDLGSPVPFLRGRLSHVHASPPTVMESLLLGFHILSAFPKAARWSDQSGFDISTSTPSKRTNAEAVTR